MTPTEEALRAAEAAWMVADGAAHVEVLTVGRPPGGWSGAYAAFQEVSYRVIEKWPRKVSFQPAERISVVHAVVACSRTADPTFPRLDPSLFKPSEKLVVFLVLEADVWHTTGENNGAFSATAEVLAAVRELTREAAP